MKRGNPIFIVLGVFFFLIAAAVIGALIWGLNGHSFSFLRWKWPENFGESRMLTGNTVLLQEETYALTSVNNLEIIMVSEDMRVTFTDDESATIRYYGPKDWEERLQIEQTGHSLRFISPLRKVVRFSFGFNASPYCEVFLPQAYAEQLSLSTVSGELFIGEGAAQFASFQAGTTSGDIDIVTDITADDANVISISGDITLDALSGGQASVGSTSGEIRLAAWEGGGFVSTVSGTIDIGLLRLTGDVRLSSTSGEIIAMLSPDSDFTFKADTLSGDIDTNFPMRYEGRRKNNASAVVGAGTHRLDAGTVSGDIEIICQ